MPLLLLSGATTLYAHVKTKKQEEYCVYRVLNAATFHIYYSNSYLPFRVNL